MTTKLCWTASKRRLNADLQRVLNGTLHAQLSRDATGQRCWTSRLIWEMSNDADLQRIEQDLAAWRKRGSTDWNYERRRRAWMVDGFEPDGHTEA